MTLDAREGLVRIVVRLLDERHLFALTLIEAILDRVGFFEALECENEQLRVVLVRERRKRNRREASRLEPMNGRCVDCNRLLSRHVRTIFEIAVLTLLLRLKQL